MEQNKREIDIIELGAKVLKQWRVLLFAGLIGAICGIIIALCNPKTYTVNVMLAPEYQEDSLAIHPNIYPDMVNSQDFVEQIKTIPVRTASSNHLLRYDEHIQAFKQPFWTKPRRRLSMVMAAKAIVVEDNESEPAIDVYRRTPQDEELYNAVTKLITCTVNKKTNIVTISVADQDPMVAAIVADSAQNLLQRQIIFYKTEKARTDYAFYKERVAKTKELYHNARVEYAEYAEAYMHATLPQYQVRKTELENILQSHYNAYSFAEQQLRAAETKIQEQTPAFMQLNHPVMPIRASSTSRLLQVLIWIILAEVISAIAIILQK